MRGFLTREEFGKKGKNKQTQNPKKYLEFAPPNTVTLVQIDMTNFGISECFPWKYRIFSNKRPEHLFQN